jgi:hypothetical protein
MSDGCCRAYIKLYRHNGHILTEVDTFGRYFWYIPLNILTVITVYVLPL